MGVLVVTVVTSLISPKGRAQNAVTNARSHATQYLDLSFETDQRLREKTFEALLDEERIIRALPDSARNRTDETPSAMKPKRSDPCASTSLRVRTPAMQ